MTTAIVGWLQDIREAHARHQALRRELACYTSLADLDDIMAAIDRFDDAETQEIRRILAAQRMQAGRRMQAAERP